MPKPKKAPKDTTQLLTVVPMGESTKWSTFWAEYYNAVWEDGKIGTQNMRMLPSDEERQKMIDNIKIAREKLAKYDMELFRAWRLLAKSNTTP